MRSRIREVATHGVRRGAAVALATASIRVHEDLSFVVMGFPLVEDPDAHEGSIEEFAGHAEAVARITPPEEIIERILDN